MKECVRENRKGISATSTHSYGEPRAERRKKGDEEKIVCMYVYA